MISSSTRLEDGVTTVTFEFLLEELETELVRLELVFLLLLDVGGKKGERTASDV